MRSSDLQSLRKRNGESFEESCRRSWLALPGVWRMKISDAAGCGSRPADELVLTKDYNFLCEEKSCDRDVFPLSLIRPDQVRGLLDFESAVPGRNIGILAVRFSMASQAFLLRFPEFIRYLKKRNQNQVHREELLKGACPCIRCPQVVIYPETYDFSEVFSLCK